MKKEWHYFTPIVAICLLVLIVAFIDRDTVSYSSQDPKPIDTKPVELPSNIKCKNVRCLLDCIRQVETGGEPKEGINAVGDGGKSHGPYQIQQAAVDYASKYDKSLAGVKATDLSGTTGSLTGEQRKALSEKIMLANWAQAATANEERRAKNWGNEELARIHNGGPSGHISSSTLQYWEKVKKCMKDKCPDAL